MTKAKGKKNDTCHHVQNTVVLTERLLLVTSLPLYNAILVPELYVWQFAACVEFKGPHCYWNSFSVITVVLSNINIIETLRYFTWWDFPIWRSNVWTMYNSLWFYFFNTFLALRMCEMYYTKFHMKSVTLFFHKTHIIIF